MSHRVVPFVLVSLTPICISSATQVAPDTNSWRGMSVDSGRVQQPTSQQAEASVSKVANVRSPVAISPDGRLVTGFFGTAGNLPVRDLLTGETRNLTQQGYPQLHMGSLFSPEGNQIAYVWHNEHDFDDLRLIRTDGSDQRLLFRDAGVRSIHVKDWAEDGSRILVTIVKRDAVAEVAYVPVDGGAPEVILSLNPGEPVPQAMALSPDGRFIAYDVSTEPDGSAHDIYLMLAEGSAPKPTVDHPGDDRLLAWSPDGEGVLFASDRSGNVDIWLASVSDGASRGDLRLLKRDVGQFTPLGLTRDGSYYFGVRREDSHLYIADLDPETGRLDASPRIVAPALYCSGVDWSPDGRYLAYAKPGGVREGSWVLAVRSLDTGDETEFKLQLDPVHELRPSWSPDGQRLLVHGWERGRYPRQGVYAVSVETGEVTRLFGSESIWQRLMDWVVWSADGQALFFTEETADSVGVVKRGLTSQQETYLVRDAQPPYRGRLAPSRNGRMLAYGTRYPDLRKDALAVLSLEDGDHQVLLEVPDSMRIWPSAWTSDSRHLVYQSQGHLWRIPAGGGAPEELGDLGLDRYRRFNLSIHPDGHRIAFTAETQYRSEVWKISGLFAAR